MAESPLSPFRSRLRDLAMDSLLGLIAAYLSQLQDAEHIEEEKFLSWVAEGAYEAGEYEHFIRTYLLRERLAREIHRLELREYLIRTEIDGIVCLRITDELRKILSR